MTALSSLLSRFNEPETLKMAKLGRELRASGVDVIDLSLGEPDFPTPLAVKEAAKKAIANILACPWSGVVFEFMPDYEERLKLYFEVYQYFHGEYK